MLVSVVQVMFFKKLVLSLVIYSIVHINYYGYMYCDGM